MLISNEKKIVIGEVNHVLTYKDEVFIVADDSIIDMMYDAYEKHKKLGRKALSFSDFCIHYIAGDYNYTIKQGWQ